MSYEREHALKIKCHHLIEKKFCYEKNKSDLKNFFAVDQCNNFEWLV